ncbi:MAG: hypothetical protein FWE74_08630 [Oscillospiraceae bacterium]|nr:hypothetical protein [Oscillospiraceae bacterium]
MNNVLVLQLINTWDFSFIKDSVEVSVYINGVKFPHVTKKGGYRILTLKQPLPVQFSLKVQVKSFLPFETCDYDNEVITIELLPEYPPHGSQIISVNPPAYIAFGYGYYKVENNLEERNARILIKNPSFENLEGRRFLLRDTVNKKEEFIIIGDVLDIKLSEYRTPALSNEYKSQSTALFPSFYTGNNVSEVYVKQLPKNTPIWIY